MPAAELSLATFNALLLKSEGRDKLGRTFQYFFRMVAGLLTRAGYIKGSTTEEYVLIARALTSKLADARRTHRWCKEIPVIQSIPATLKISDPMDRAMELMQKLTLATFMIIDHTAWLKQVKILKSTKTFGAAETIQLGLKFFCVSNMLASIINARKTMALGDEKHAEKAKTKKLAIKHFLLIFQTAHMSKLYETDDGFVGACGVVSSMMDLMTQWPEKK